MAGRLVGVEVAVAGNSYAGKEGGLCACALSLTHLVSRAAGKYKLSAGGRAGGRTKAVAA
jgi:hypothetical protein